MQLHPAILARSPGSAGRRGGPNLPSKKVCTTAKLYRFQAYTCLARKPLHCASSARQASSCKAAAKVYPGNSADSATLSDQIAKVFKRFC